MADLRNRFRDALAKPWRVCLNRLPRYSRKTVQANRQQLQVVENELRLAQIMIDQLSLTIKDLGGWMPPPMKLQTRVANRYLDRFLADAVATVKEFDRILGAAGQSLKTFEVILDFGSGCGRITTPLRAYVGSGVSLYATDIDREAIEWCRENYSGIAEFEVNDAWPPLKFADDTFDFIYSVSVLTHLPEEMQFKWLKELNRILKPNGFLLLTTHGEGYYDQLSAVRQAELAANGFLYFNNGLTPGLPEFYQTTFHTPEYIRRHWSEHLQIVRLEPRGILGRQDAILCTKKQS